MEGLSQQTCTKCGASWLNGQLYWSTGAQGKNEDLAGLVCNNLLPEGKAECANPMKGVTGGDTWEYRRGMIDGIMKEFERANRVNKTDEGLL